MLASHVYSYPNLREIVATVIRNHPPDCIFQPDALESIVAGIPSEIMGNQAALIDHLVVAVQKQEIYCPHEGIDRRKTA